MVTLLLQIYLITNWWRFSHERFVKSIWASVFFWTCFHTVPLPTPKKLDVTSHPVMKCNGTIILDMSFEQRFFEVVPFMSDCKFAINYWCCIGMHHHYISIFWINQYWSCLIKSLILEYKNNMSVSAYKLKQQNFSTELFSKFDKMSWQLFLSW